jgi:hypothetical protein
VTYARLGDELVRILAIQHSNVTTGNRRIATALLVVSRGFDGTKPSAYPAGTMVLGPLYNTRPSSAKKATDGFSYGLMASSTLASDYLANFATNALAEGYDGSWYDNFGSHIHTVETATGLQLGVQDYYDPAGQHYWNVTTYIAAQKGRLDRAYAAVMQHGRPSGDKSRPTILANGFWSGFGAYGVEEGCLYHDAERQQDARCRWQWRV